MATSHPLIVDINLVQDKIKTVLSQVADEGSCKVEIILDTLRDIQRLLVTLSDHFSSKEQDASIKELVQQHIELIESIVKRLEEGDKKVTDEYALLREKVAKLEERVKELEADRCMLMACQLAFEIHKAVINRVLLPNWKTQHCIYTIYQMEKALKGKGNYADVFKNVTQREAAKKRWEELKVGLKWESRHSRYIDELKGLRLSAAHPKFDPAAVVRDVESGKVDVVDKEMFMECFDMWGKIKPPDAQSPGL